MQKVVYSVTRVMKEDNLKVKGVGYISDTDLLTIATNKDNTPFIRIFEDCIKYCHKVSNTTDEFKGTYYEVAEYEGHDIQRTFYIWYKLIA